MDVFLKQVDIGSRYILDNLFPYYVYDMSEFMGWDPDADGCYTFKVESLDPYWQAHDHTPYFIYWRDQLAGFVLVRKYPTKQAIFDVEQFFVLRKFKGKGVGRNAFLQVVDRHPGCWQVRVLKENSGALAFWQSAVSDIVGDDFKIELDNDVDLEMHFIRFDKPI
ncbi:GNAT family N-acetyltransferase [Vibrio kasasachensis]|uniref:GNAT family N-acetyltransferase n=1 Tax=Vibrio kasasachensis TaxID=2910248 RepID=UPI003D0F7DEE